MSFDSLLALLGLAAAIYAIMPRARQLDLLLRVERRDWATMIAGLVAIHYLLFFEVFSSVGFSPGCGHTKPPASTTVATSRSPGVRLSARGITQVGDTIPHAQ